MTTIAWVIGGRGLLGGAIGDAVSSRSGWYRHEAPPLAWSDDRTLTTQVHETSRRLFDDASAMRADWAIIWAAGAAITASSSEQLHAELAQLSGVLAAIGVELAPDNRGGAVFYASSAGGVYGGSTGSPFSEDTIVAPISSYGRFKLSAETIVADFCEAHGVSSLLGRIANLYGPGQKLHKMQGLISQLAKAQYSPKPASIYVSLDTMRDYIYTKDCAGLVCDALDRLTAITAASGPRRVTKILASGQSVTIASLLGHFRSITKHQPNVMLGSSSSSKLQGRDLRLRSVVWPDLDHRPFTPLPVGIHSTMQDILSGLQHADRVPEDQQHI